MFAASRGLRRLYLPVGLWNEGAIPVNILETERLIICRLSIAHAAFILELLNDAAFLRFIGDKGVRTLNDAR